ncbi:MAG: ribbon-helix-helix domain-containing protein [Candidatus Bathyarchaeia archaeon]
MESQNDKWGVVRVPISLISQIEKLVENEKDEFGLPKYRSKSDAVTEAIKEFLRKREGLQWQDGL